MSTFLEVGNSSYPVDTDLHFTEFGELKLKASVQIDEETFLEYGDSYNETLDNLVSTVRTHIQ